MSVAVRQGARLRAGRYELDRLLGHGGAASVWLATDTLLERPVAVKLLSEGLAADASWLARFKREARIAARLQHPNLVSIYDFDAEAERPYLVMAYLPGGSLANRLEQGGCPDSERLAHDVLAALEHIHAAGIIHRDVKPANVLLDRQGRACLTDFGIARPEDATSITQTGQIPGTARYMAPELWRGEPASERSDLFSCGVLLAQCVSEERSSPHLIALVERLAAEDPASRPESAAAALALLDRRRPPASGPIERDPTPVTSPMFLGTADPPTPTPPVGGPMAHGHGGPSKRWPAIAGLAVVILAAAIALASSLGGGDGSPGEGSSGQAAGNRSQEPREQASAPAGDGSETGSPADPAAAAEPAADPYALNDQGFDLIGQGRYGEAIPLLEQSVAGFESSGNTDDLTYAYALYNLGHALRLAGRPAEAVPILEQRLEIPNQTGVVAQELELARAEAGISEKPGKGPKPDKPAKPEKDD